MVKRAKDALAIDPADVSVLISSSGMSTRGGHRRRLSRELDTRSLQMILTHRPTGVGVIGQIPSGHFSRGDMRRFRDELHARLLVELARAVAVHLRVPGR